MKKLVAVVALAGFLAAGATSANAATLKTDRKADSKVVVVTEKERSVVLEKER